MFQHFLGYKKLAAIFISIFTFDIGQIVVDNNMNFYQMEKISNLVDNKQLIILPENRNGDMLDIKNKELDVIKNLNSKYEIAFDNISPKYQNLINRFNKKKIYPLEFVKEAKLNYEDYDLVNYCYVNNIKINTIGFNQEEFFFIKSNGITDEVSKKYKVQDLKKYNKKSNIVNSFYFVEDNLILNLKKLLNSNKKIVLIIDINHFAGYKEKNNFYKQIENLEYMMINTNDESIGDYKVVNINKVNKI